MSLDKRRFKRYDVDGVAGTLILNLEVRVLDLSLTGMSVETSTALKPGTTYSIRIQREGGEPLRFPAIARWSRLVRTAVDARGDVTPIYRSGLDFRESLDEKARWILEFIERHIVLELDDNRRVAGRFRVRSEDNLFAVDTTGEFVTRRLSQSGMLIETEVVPPPGAVLELTVRHDGQSFVAGGRVANVERHDSHAQKAALVGVEFLGLSPAATRAVVAIIESAL